MSVPEFLFSIVGIILALAISDLIKGFNLLIKYQPDVPKERHENRWKWRLWWFFSLTLLISQYVWGIRQKLNDIDNIFYFIYYIILTGLIYAITLYIFPESAEKIYKEELRIISNSKKEQERKKVYTQRLIRFYYLFTAWLLATIIVNFIFYFKDKTDTLPDFIIGITLKITCILLIWFSIKRKKRADLSISNLDYLIIYTSIATHIWYFYIRIE